MCLNWRKLVAIIWVALIILLVLVSIKYSDVSLALYISIMMVCAMFASTTIFYWIKIKETILLIKTNRDLTHTIKAILQVFPEGVLIRSLDETARKVVTAYINNAAQNIFDRDLRKVCLKEIDVNPMKVCKINEQPIDCKPLNMKEFLKQQELKLENSQDSNKICEQLIELRRNFTNFEEFKQPDCEEFKHEETQTINKLQISSYYSVKTIKVNWNDNKHSYLHVFIDTTKIKKLEEESAKSKYQQLMFSSISHELRTPLNAFVNSTQLIGITLSDFKKRIIMQPEASAIFDNLHPKLDRFLRIGEISSKLLIVLVENILDFVKFSSNTFKANIDCFCLQDLLSEIQFIFGFQCEQKQLNFTIKCDDALKSMKLTSDAKRIKQVLINLISNSFKFTEVGGISLQIKLLRQSDSSYIQFSIVDSGIGISEFDMPKLFNMFNMTQNISSPLGQSGSGIGLSISKMIVESLGGEIKVSSEIGKWTDFTFIIQDACASKVYDHLNIFNSQLCNVKLFPSNRNQNDSCNDVANESENIHNIPLNFDQTVQIMKFDRLSAISEIAKYYGKLDKVFRLLNCLNTRTRKIWANTCIQLSKDITRKSIKFDCSNNNRFIYFSRRNRFALTLFKTTVISPKTTDEMKIILKLLENVDCPPMAMITIDMILSPERNSYLALSNYTKCMKEIDLSFMDLYNKIIDVAIKREFQLSLLNCYIFIHEIPNLKDIKYIRSILIPCNRDSDSESLISIWKELCDSKKIEFNDVILIWDDMQLEKFFNIFSAVSNYKIRLLIHANIENIELNKLFEKISLNKLDQFSIKICRKAEYIMWESTWHINEICLKNCHYQSPCSHKKVFNFAWCQIKYQNCLNYCEEAKLKVSLSQTSFISFSFDLNNFTDPNFICRNNQIYVNKNELCFDERIINNAKYRTTKEDEIYFIDKPIKATNFFSADIKYIPKECLIILQITNNPLAMQDICNLIDCIPSFGNIKMLSLLIQNLSCAIKILKWCMRTDSVTFIHLILVEIFNCYQRFDVELILNQLKLQRKRIQIYSLKDYSDYYKI